MNTPHHQDNQNYQITNNPNNIINNESNNEAEIKDNKNQEQKGNQENLKDEEMIVKIELEKEKLQNNKCTDNINNQTTREQNKMISDVAQNNKQNYIQQGKKQLSQYTLPSAYYDMTISYNKQICKEREYRKKRICKTEMQRVLLSQTKESSNSSNQVPVLLYTKNSDIIYFDNSKIDIQKVNVERFIDINIRSQNNMMGSGGNTSNGTSGNHYYVSRELNDDNNSTGHNRYLGEYRIRRRKRRTIRNNQEE